MEDGMSRCTSQLITILCALFMVGAYTIPAESAHYDVRLIDPQAWADSQLVDSTVESPSSTSASIGLWVNPQSDSGRAEGGFDCLITYETDHAQFLDATRGPDLHSEWEYFSWRSVLDTTGGGSQRLIRVVGIADMLDGETPPNEAFNLAGVVVEFEFYVANVDSQTDVCVPITFYSRDCGDNVIATVTGDTLYIPASGHEPAPGWNADSCVALSPETMIPDIAFTPGEICVAPAPSLGRGDLNGNGISYEIADAVLFSVWFAYGFDVFTLADPQAQYLAADINCDGFYGSILDFVYLIGIITGDKQPCNEFTPSGGLVPSVDDTLRIPDITVGPGDVFDVDIELTNVDTIGAVSFRLRFDPSFMHPMGTTMDSTFVVDVELLRNASLQWSVVAAMVEPGVITGAVLSFIPETDAILPGSGPTIRVPFQVFHASQGQSSPLEFETDPLYPDVHNALADIDATIWKRPVLIDGDITVTGSPTTPYDVRLVDPVAWADSLVVDPTVDAPSGGVTSIGLWINPQSANSLAEGGFDFLVTYDDSHASYLGSLRGADLHPEWEYISWRHSLDTVGATVQALIRVVGIADIADGVIPDDAAFNLSGIIAEFEFGVANNGSPTEVCIPFQFYAADCGDNVISSVSGDTLFFPQSGHLPGPGWNADSCMNASPETLFPGITFSPGEICVSAAQPLSRGDINGNGIPYEIGDAVLFSRFFTYGFDVFILPDPMAQYLATDINCDGIYGTTADFVYLLGIIHGTHQPCGMDSVFISSDGAIPSIDDTLLIPDISVGPDDVFDVEVELTNVDTLGAVSFRLRFNPSFMMPVGTATDSTFDVDVELLRDVGNDWAVSAAMVEPGVITGAVLSFDPVNAVLLPGSGPTIRLQFQAFHGSAGQSSPLTFESDPLFPDAYNTLADITGTIWKHPTLVNGLITVTGAQVGERGDINLNGLPYEISDALILSRFFTYGFDVFPPSDPHLAYAASDINCDTLPGGLVDLTYMLGIFVGNLQPCDAFPPPPPATGPSFSASDTLRIPDVTTGPGDVFDLDIELANVDTLSAISFRITYDPSFMLPIGTATDSVYTIDFEFLRDSSNLWSVMAAEVTPGSITGLAVKSDPALAPLLPGSGPTLRMQFQAFHGSLGQSSPVQLEVDPAFSHVHNALSNDEATIWKRPVLVDGTVSVTDFCSCPSQADMDGNGTLESTDLNAIIQVVFFNGEDITDPSCPASRADFNGDGYADAVDVNAIINHAFFNGPGPANPCD
ncbi:MAG: hypothetical protein GF341_05270 [candidate division Zixibacteria bacterium]|nr:hypothetical protein [candidate division Zixibacteria bacterium]